MNSWPPHAATNMSTGRRWWLRTRRNSRSRPYCAAFRRWLPTFELHLNDRERVIWRRAHLTRNSCAQCLIRPTRDRCTRLLSATRSSLENAIHGTRHGPVHIACGGKKVALETRLLARCNLLHSSRGHPVGVESQGTLRFCSVEVHLCASTTSDLGEEVTPVCEYKRTLPVTANVRYHRQHQG